MKFVVNTVVNEVLNKVKSSKEESLFLINGFEDLDIYVNICQKLTSNVNKLDRSITIKLAKNKWEYFKAKYQGSPSLHLMEQNGWVLTNESTTDYRNQHLSDVLVLLGTENEEDITGSLKDIYQINCNELYKMLPEFKNRIDYSLIYEKAGVDFSESDKEVVNKLYTDLFEFKTKDICKLSYIVDHTYLNINTINDFIERFYKDLPSWGLPKKELNLPKSSQCKGNKNLLRSEYNFITGTTFKNMASSYKKYSLKLEKYEEDHKEYSSQWSGWGSQSIKSYSDFSARILEFIRGNRTEKIKKELTNLDFAIVEDVLGLKLPIEHKRKIQNMKLYGNPLSVFTSSWLFVLNELRGKSKMCNSIIFAFKEVDIVTETSSDEGEGLVETWKNICVHTNGVIETLSSCPFTLNNEDIILNYEPNNIFEITTNLNPIIHAASPTKKMHRIIFSIQCFNNQDKLKEEFDFEWIFEPNESWLNAFSDLVKEEFVKTPNNPYIPLTTLNNIEHLVMKKSEEEFFDFLMEKCNLDFSCNILENSCHTDLFNKNSKYPLFYDLGLKFSNFCNKLLITGIYNALSNEKGNVHQLIDAYTILGKKITESKFDENEYYILDLFLHAFNVEQDNKSISKDKDIECCIVPPWHPASLEKIKHRNLFFLDGCYEFWSEVEKQDFGINIDNKYIKNKVEELSELSVFQNAVDVFPMNNTSFFGSINSYGEYSLYASKAIKPKNSLRDLVKKEFVFDDEFKNNSYSTMNEDSYMIYGVIQNYINAFPDSKDKLSLVFIDPSDLQPIISSIHRYIKEYQHKYGEEKELSISLSILVKPENKGGKNYITYWMNESFDLDSNIKIKTYMNEWKNKDELEKLLNGNNDIVFVMDMLKINDFEFISKIDSYTLSMNECYFPIVLRPSPASNTTTRRRIELTQPQFSASRLHTQVVHYRKNLEVQSNDLFYAVKTVDIDEDMQNLVLNLHKKAYWVVCIDASMDGKLLKDNNTNNEYSVIGFSTGKGKYGQYNITITARNSILKSIESNFSSRLSRMFHWNNELVTKASRICMNEAAKLDGISVLTASNQRDYNVNEFMAYVLTSLRDREVSDDSPLKIIVHLDSYKHWFEEKTNIKNIFETESSKSRPDFLMLRIGKDFSEKIKIYATVIECKTATILNKNEHVDKAQYQVKHGIEVLSKIFDPNSQMLKRRYWYAQLYRALAFAQISFNNSSAEFNDLSNKLRGILNGEFEIEWDGEVLGYWLDMIGEDETVEELCQDVKLYNIPQKRIQKIILGDDEQIQYVNIDVDLLDDQKDFENKVKIQENKIDEMVKFRKMNNYFDDEPNKFFKSEIKKQSTEMVEQNEKIEEVISTVELVNQNKEEKVENQQKEVVLEFNATNTINNEDINVLIGNDRFNKEVNWGFGNKHLANRHMLITGTSGQGKTYSIQTMLYELSKFNISSIIFDYTEGFRIDQLEPKFVEKMGEKVSQHFVKMQGVPINPFKQHEIDFAGMKMLEKPADVAARFANILIHVYGFGDQQFSAIFEATRIGLEKYGNDMDMYRFQEELEQVKSKNKAAQTVLSKMAPFFYSITFSKDDNFDWGNILYSDNSQTNIFQLTMIDREMQVIITELMLWDAWYYTKKHGSKDKPFIVVLDEAQNLSHKSNSPSAAILTEGRKFGWSAWFATQSLKILSDDEVVRLLQSAFKLYFKPTDDEIVKMSKQLDPTDGNAWLSSLKNLKKGQCIVVGDRIRADGTFGSCKPTITSVSSFEKRD